MVADENVALLVNAPNLSPGSAGSTYPNYVSTHQPLMAIIILFCLDVR